MSSLIQCIGSLIHWINSSLTHWLIASLIQWFIDSKIRCFIDALTRKFTDSLIQWLSHWFVASRTHWSIDSIRCCLDSYWLTDSLNHWFCDWFSASVSCIHWRIDSWIHWFSQSVVHGFFHVISLTISALPCFCISSTSCRPLISYSWVKILETVAPGQAGPYLVYLVWTGGVTPVWYLKNDAGNTMNTMNQVWTWLTLIN